MVKLKGATDGNGGSTIGKGDSDGELEGVDFEEVTETIEASKQPLIVGKVAVSDEDTEYSHNFLLVFWKRPILAVWNVILVLLGLLCLAELFKGAHFSFRVSHALSQVFLPSAIGPQRRRYRPQPTLTINDSLWAAMSMLIGLGVTIAVNFWFLHIIFLAYYYLRSKQKRPPSLKELSWTIPSPPATPISVEPTKVGSSNVPDFFVVL